MIGKKGFNENVSDLKEIIYLIPKACDILEASFKYFFLCLCHSIKNAISFG